MNVLEVSYRTCEQIIACLRCQAIDEVPDYAFPQVPGPWDKPCPECGERWVCVGDLKSRSLRECDALEAIA